MRILLCALLLVASAAQALPDDAQERDAAAAKERLQKMLDEAALLEKSGHPEEAARVRAEATALKKRIAGATDEDAPREPLHEALHRLEQAIGALDRAGYEGMARDLRGAADGLRAEIRRRDGDGAERREKEALGKPRREPEVEFWSRNTDTLRLGMKALAEAQKRDAADLVERAIHAREVMVSGRKDEEARQIMRKGPDDGRLAEIMFAASECWRQFEQPEKAAQCEELARYLAKRSKEDRPERMREGPRPDDRMAEIEARLDRMERMLREALERTEGRDREREPERDRDRGGR